MLVLIAACVPTDADNVDSTLALPDYCAPMAYTEPDCGFEEPTEGCVVAGEFTVACRSHEPLFPECSTWVGRGATTTEACPTWDEVVERSGILNGTGLSWLDMHGPLDMAASREAVTREWSPWIRWSVPSTRDDSENRITFHFHRDGRLRGIEQAGWSVYVGNVEGFCCESTNGFVDSVTRRFWGDVPDLDPTTWRWIGTSLDAL